MQADRAALARALAEPAAPQIDPPPRHLDSRRRSGSAPYQRHRHVEPVIQRDAVEARDTVEARRSPPLPLGTFPAGARPGQIVHTILERIAFHDTNTLGPVVEEVLRAEGFSPEQASSLERGLQAVLATPLPAGCRLCDLQPGTYLPELEFLFPVRRSGRGGTIAAGLGPLAASDLGRLLHEHRYPTAAPSYPNVLSRLGFRPLTGFLRGFIDLVFEHDGRFWVVDYKTNHLGDAVEDYSEAALLGAMAEHHYHLQSLIYSVATVRHLRHRVPDWHAGRFGGVLYLFLRGMAPGHGSAGIFHDRPSDELVLALDAVLDGASP